MMFTVTTTQDQSDGATADGLSLREAIALANARPGADRIVFAAGPGDAFEAGGLIRLTQGELEITDAVVIDGTAAGGAVVITGDALGDDALLDDGPITDVRASLPANRTAPNLLADNSRVFTITNPDAETTLAGLTVTGGSGRGAASNDYSGGGIRSLANLVGRELIVSGNGFFVGEEQEDFQDGGGLAVYANLELYDSDISNNFVSGETKRGGGIFAKNAFLFNSEITANSVATDGFGGGIFANNITIIDSIVSFNSAGGLNIGYGGGLYGNNIVVIESNIKSNSVSGADIAAHGGGISGVFDDPFDGFETRNGSVFLMNSIVNGNSISGGNSGAGISAATVTAVGTEISENTIPVFGSGAAISADHIWLMDSLISDNVIGDADTPGIVAETVVAINTTFFNNVSTIPIIPSIQAILASDVILYGVTVTGGIAQSERMTLSAAVSANNLKLKNSLILGNGLNFIAVDGSSGNNSSLEGGE
jgi:CSLREA domain-containing protein